MSAISKLKLAIKFICLHLFFSERCWTGEITALTSEYQGEVKKIIGVFEKDTDKNNRGK